MCICIDSRRRVANSEVVQDRDGSGFQISRRAFLSGTVTLTAVAVLGGCDDAARDESTVEQPLTGSFTGRLGTRYSRPGNFALGAA